jgi:hypothetical protein
VQRTIFRRDGLANRRKQFNQFSIRSPRSAHRILARPIADSTIGRDGPMQLFRDFDFGRSTFIPLIGPPTTAIFVMPPPHIRQQRVA